jgi:hypothetical protein
MNTSRTRLAKESGESTWMIRPARLPLSRGRHAFRFAFLLLAWFLGLSLTFYVVAVTIGRAMVQPTTTESELDDIVRVLEWVSVLVWTYVTIGRQATKVDYRPADTFMMLIPIWGLFVFLPKTIWRLAGLPGRRWRADGGAAVSAPPAGEDASMPSPAPSGGPLPPPPPPLPEMADQAAGPGLPSPGGDDQKPGGATGPEQNRPRIPIWGVAALIGLTVMLCSALVVRNASDDDRRASVPKTPTEVQDVSHEVPADADPSPSSLQVAGQLDIRSKSAIKKTTPWGTTDCRRGDPGEKSQATAVRLSFTTDQSGDTVIGAAGVWGAPKLVYATVAGGTSMCAWRVRFSTTLPADTVAFFIQYGYTNSYWGPFSASEAGNIHLAATR